jgi:hypothetical protein
MMQIQIINKTPENVVKFITYGKGGGLTQKKVC